MTKKEEIGGASIKSPEATREEIREVIDAYTDDECLYQDNPCEFLGKVLGGGYCNSAEGSYICLMKRLDELGVVIKIEGELPENPYEPPLDTTQEGWRDVVEARTKQMLNAGFKAVKSLIKEE